MTQLHQSDALPLMERMLEQVVEQDSKARAELEAKLEKQQAMMEMQQAEMEQLKAELIERRIREELTPKPPREAVSEQQLSALQARLESVHKAKLLTDDEFFALEDLCADFGESTVLAAKMQRLAGLSEQMQGDAAFARQARRKFV